MSGASAIIRDAFGMSPAKVEELPGGATCAALSLEQFLSVVGNWRQMKPEARPQLRGIFPSPAENARHLLNLILELKDAASLLCLEVEFGRDRSFPDLSDLWPAATWWQEELSVFEGVRIENQQIGLRGAQWQQA